MNNTLKNPYFQAVENLLQKIEQTQADALEKAAQAIALSLEKDGILHTFGCGHSGSVTIDAFHRSGCFAAVDAILDPGLMFQSGAHAGTAFERLGTPKPSWLSIRSNRRTYCLRFPTRAKTLPALMRCYMPKSAV